MEQCPYCGKQIKEGDRFCLGCGRQLATDTVDVSQKGGISDLKNCFGSFPISKIDCYLCADELKCSHFAGNTRQNEILNRLEKISEIHGTLADMNEVLVDMRRTLSSINDNIGTMNNNIKRLK